MNTGDPSEGVAVMITGWSDILLTTAQVAVAFAGFTGLIGLFITRDRSVVTRDTILRFRTMLDYSLITLLAALFPFLPAALQLPDASIWRVCSVAMLLGLAGYWLLIGRFLIRSARLHGKPNVVEMVLIGGDVGVALVLIENAVGFFHPPSFFSYLAVVFWQLVGAVFGFAGVVSLAWSSQAE